VGLVLACAFVTVHAHGGISPDRLAAVNIAMFPAPCPVNDMTLRDLRGNQIDLASLKGSVVLLNFWKIDCPPCAQEKPTLEAVHRKLGQRGLSVVAVNLFDDQNRMREYVRSSGFTFTFASDPDRRLRVQTQNLPSGIPTCFVVNPKSEAIYEISMVPTTYVIDRGGRIVARASGMANWGHPDAEQFLETLLGPPALAQTGPRATPAAANTAVSVVPTAATSKPTGAETTTLADYTQRGAAPERIVQAQLVKPATESDPVRARTSSDTAQRLPFGGSSSVSSQPDKATESARPTPGKPSSGPKSKSASANPPLVKPSRESSAKPAPGLARQVGSPSPVAGRPPDFNRPAGQARAPSALGGTHEDYTSIPRQTGPSTPGATTARPAPAVLPPAMPYVDPRGPTATSPRTGVAPQRSSRTSPPPVLPDEKGYVTARVPASPDKSQWGRTPSPQADSPLARQYSAPVAPPPSGRDTVSNFVLESFNSPEAPRTAAPTPQQPATNRGPASVILNPLQQLGAGIRDTVSKILPGR